MTAYRFFSIKMLKPKILFNFHVTADDVTVTF